MVWDWSDLISDLGKTEIKFCIVPFFPTSHS